MKTVCFIMIVLLMSLPASGLQTSEVRPRQENGAAEGGKNYFTDVILVNQSGEKMRFYSDLIKDRVVIINVFFSSCHGSCPVMMKTFQKIQEWLGDRLGKDAYLISISVDPEMDTPEKLKEYATQLKAKPGWYFVTGEKKNVEFALRRIGQYVDVRENHSNVFYVGKESTRLWKRAFGLARAEDLIEVVESVLNDQG